MSDAATVGIPSPTIGVIGTGFGRTGTLSLREALVRLGFGPCDHMLENLQHPERFALWHDAFERKQAGAPIDWRPLLAGYGAIVDWPGAYFWRELIVAHPEARVVLTVRDPERWYESCLATIFRLRARADASVWSRLMVKLVGMIRPGMGNGFQVIDEVIWKGTFDGRFSDRDYALRVFDDHIREVLETVPAERLLVFDVKEGWGPLCAFLGVPVPEGEPFPHVNDAAEFGRRQRELMQRVAVGLVTVLGAVAGTIGLVRILRRRSATRSGRD